MVVVGGEGNCPMDTLFVGEVAKVVSQRLGRDVSPREITDLFYRRIMPDEMGPVVGGRRLIRREAVDLIILLLGGDEPAGGEVGDDA